jgi:hypothetical protein
MWKRRATSMLCVLLSHAVLLFALLHLTRTSERAASPDDFVSGPITIYIEPLISRAPTESTPIVAPAPVIPARRSAPARAPTVSPAAAGPAPATAPIPTPGRVDWPIEGRKSVSRVLAAEAEAERIARMFAGPGGTWASLTKRQRSKISKFRFKPGVDGLERDEKGNAIYHLSEGCVLVNFAFIGCALGKPKIHDDMFENMRQYFDEQRLPKTDEGNGTEPEAQPKR